MYIILSTAPGGDEYSEVISKTPQNCQSAFASICQRSVFPPSHKAAAGQAPVTLQVASANDPLQLFANLFFAIF